MRVRCGGDAGDSIFTMALLKAMPNGPHDLFLVDRPSVQPFIARAPLLIPLFKSQSYVRSVKCCEDSPDVDLTPFRKFHSHSTTLISAQAAEFQLQMRYHLDCDGSGPWIEVDPSEETKGKIIIARSPRYRNEYFPWSDVVKFYGQDLMFVGLPDEHEDFCNTFGYVKHRKIKDFLELAQLIAGSNLFIGNQSSPNAVALAIGHPCIQECSPIQPDCIYRRDNIQFVGDGSCVLPSFNGGQPKEVAGRYKPNLNNIPRQNVPPGGWQYKNLPSQSIHSMMINLVMQLEECDKATADDLLIKANIERRPDFFKGYLNTVMANFELAKEKAGMNNLCKIIQTI